MQCVVMSRRLVSTLIPIYIPLRSGRSTTQVLPCLQCNNSFQVESFVCFSLLLLFGGKKRPVRMIVQHSLQEKSDLLVVYLSSFLGLVYVDSPIQTVPLVRLSLYRAFPPAPSRALMHDQVLSVSPKAHSYHYVQSGAYLLGVHQVLVKSLDLFH